MKPLLIVLACLSILAASLSVTGCNDAHAALGSASPPGNKVCTVQFRRDALGAAAALPISPTTANFNGSATSVSGTLKLTTDEWVVLEQAGKEMWISKSVVLLIQYQ